MTAPDFKKGFTLIELLIVVTLLLFLIAVTYNAFLTGQSLWYHVDHDIELNDNLRKAFDRITPELAMSGHDKRGFFQVAVSQNSGYNNSDILRFSIPVICQTGANPVDAEGNTAHWGAPLTWGCAMPSCMDRDNNCDTVEYKYIEYLLKDGDLLVRRVLDYSQNPVREDIVASHITNLQAEIADNERMVTVSLTGESDNGPKLKFSSSSQMNIFLRNAR